MTTKLELQQLLAQRNGELEAARLRISILEGELALRPRSPAPTPARIAYLARQATPREPSDFALRCAAAKALAMAGGKAVRV
jgi:hypothetical protein